VAKQQPARPSTYRFTAADQALMDALATALAAETGLAVSRTDAIRVAVRLECSRRGLSTSAPKQDRKQAHTGETK